MRFLEFNPKAEITNTIHMIKTIGNYDIIIGQDLLHKLGVDINVNTKTMCWNNVTIDMKPPTRTHEDALHVEEDLVFLDKINRIAKILEAKFKPANLKELTDNLLRLKKQPKRTITWVA